MQGSCKSVVSVHGEVHLPCGTLSRSNEPSANLSAPSWVSISFAKRVAAQLPKFHNLSVCWELKPPGFWAVSGHYSLLGAGDGPETQQAWVTFLASSQTSSVTLGKSLNFCISRFPVLCLHRISPLLASPVPSVSEETGRERGGIWAAVICETLGKSKSWAAVVILLLYHYYNKKAINLTHQC